MAKWQHKAIRHQRVNDRYFLQLNVPKDNRIQEHEVVVFKDGSVVDRVVGWDSISSYGQTMEKVAEHCYQLK